MKRTHNMEWNLCYLSKTLKYREVAIHPNQEKKGGRGKVSPEGFGLSLHEQKRF